MESSVSRRTFLSGFAAVGTAGLLSSPVSFADAGAAETVKAEDEIWFEPKEQSPLIRCSSARKSTGRSIRWCRSTR